MSFSEQTKTEIAGQKFHSRREETALLSAFLHTAGSLLISGGAIGVAASTENAAVCDLVSSVTGAVYRDPGERRCVGRRLELSYDGPCAARMLSDCGILDAGLSATPGIAPALVRGTGAAAAYVRGAFLGAGSVTAAEHYHLEFVLSNRTLARDLSELLAQYDVLPKMTTRKEKYVVYIKDSESVSDCLALMGAPRAVLELNNLIARRRLVGYVNRANNCEIHNMDKQVNASVEQCLAAESLLEWNVLSDERLIRTARARLRSPHASYEELGEKLGISKSGVKHRLKKLLDLAEEKKTEGGKPMIFKELEVKQAGGVTNRDAQCIVQRAMRYDSEILFEQGTKKINAKSLMGVLSMGLKKGDKLMIIVKGDDQDEALGDLAALFEMNFRL